MKARFANGDRVRVNAGNRPVIFSNAKVKEFHNLTGKIIRTKEVVGYVMQESTSAAEPSAHSVRTFYLYDVRLDAKVSINDVIEDSLDPLTEN